MMAAMMLAARLAITVATDVVSPELAAAAADEANAVWHAAGVDIEWSIGDRPGWTPEAPMLYVLFSNRCQGEPSGAMPLASIDFVNGEPLRRIVVCANQLRAVATTPDLMPRVTGRAVAHEIGHYLFGRAHTDAGLMRARHSIAEFCGVDPMPFAFILPSRGMARTLPVR
jgi:hypothetical protein